MKIKCIHKALRTVPDSENILNKLLSFIFIIVQRLLLGRSTAREGIVNSRVKYSWFRDL